MKELIEADTKNLTTGLRGELINCNCAAHSWSECCCEPAIWPEQLTNKAADRIEAQQAEIERLESAVKGLETELTIARVNDRTAMHYLEKVREVVGGKDLPDMVARAQHQQAEIGRLTKQRDELLVVLDMLVRESREVADDYHKPRYTRLDGAILSAILTIASVKGTE